MNLQAVRQEKNIEQADLAKRVGTNAPMMSNFEHYKCLPIPTMLKAICKELGCSLSDLYDHGELYVEVKGQKNTSFDVKEHKEVYKLTVSLPNDTRKMLTQENLERCGYHSLKDFIWHCCKRFEKQLAIINKKTTKQRNCSVDENGITTNISHQ